MPSYPASRRSSRRSEAQELDITPIMNVFVILVPFLLLTAVFAQTAMVDLNLPASASEDIGPSTEALNLQVSILADGFRIDGNAGSLEPIGLLEDGSYDLASLSATLDKIRSEHRAERSIIVAAAPTIRYQSVVTVMDHCKHSGFVDISIGHTQ